MRSRISSSFNPASRSACMSLSDASLGALDSRVGKAQDGALPWVEIGIFAIGENALHHLFILGKLVVAAGMHGCAIDAAIDHRCRRRANLALCPAHASAIIHDRIEEWGANLQRLDIIGKHENIVRHLGVGGRDLQRVQLFGRCLVKLDRLHARLPMRNGRGEFVDGLAHFAPRISFSPAITRI